MKKTTSRILLIANAISLALCAVTIMWVLFSGYTGWWRILSNPFTQLFYVAVALYTLCPDERSMKWLAATGLLRAAVAGWQFVHTLRYLTGVGIYNVNELLQFPAAVLFLVGIILYGKEKRNRT